MAELFQGLGPHGPLVLSLVGLRGAGKSTLGKLVRIPCPFLLLSWTKKSLLTPQWVWRRSFLLAGQILS